MNLQFFFGEFHRGTINRLLHALGFALLILGLWKWNLFLIILSFPIMEIGHVYHIRTHLKGKVTLLAKRTLLLQTVFGLIAYLFLFVFVKILQSTL